MEKTWVTRKGNEISVSLTREKISKKELLEGLLGLTLVTGLVWYFFFK